MVFKESFMEVSKDRYQVLLTANVGQQNLRVLGGFQVNLKKVQWAFEGGFKGVLLEVTRKFQRVSRKTEGCTAGLQKLANLPNTQEYNSNPS